ncbi:hypothetical protein [Paraburkholderia sp. BR10936]|uniref:hypothetical protein n=1 Tax=Paraburkholderia sp. BR10936 TaxID=3236993 RepID=UPI0034D1944C
MRVIIVLLSMGFGALLPQRLALSHAGHCIRRACFHAHGFVKAYAPDVTERVTARETRIFARETRIFAREIGDVVR